ncbi:hypothetical protein [Mucilaginibacter sp. UR6-11]|uniref:hypothetical protein n=1 Tax=Mucilaginibacter sp. UR6-11 TaxID=1435644 RepID=UPI001E291AB3|nr:hypothetical protein [Mucilaginibacter sp. UR6-11]MCC8426266.1 hypothetical protein [Mucilaginibacter sp. UR6-11]
MKKMLILCLVVLTACHSKPKTPFRILKSEKIANGAKLGVLVNSRINKQQLVDIAAYIKSDSSQYNNLQLDFILPGNSYENKGGVIVYATATYHDKAVIAPADTVKDNDNNLLSFEFMGFTPEKAKQLLTLNPQDMADKQLLGRFIDDGTKTISLIYEDKHTDGQLYILELDSIGKVIAAIQPMEVTARGIKKMVVSQQGDYMVLKDSILTMYSSADYDKPFRSLKQNL